jgi:outer membrane protein assembly factor BamA
MQLRTDSIEKKALEQSGFVAKNFNGRPVNLQQMQQIKERVLNYYEKNGYPFGSIYLDSIELKNNTVTALLKLSRGPLYHIDSIRINGKIKLSNILLQRHLGIMNGSVYNKEKLEQISKRLLELPYITETQTSDLMLLGTGSILNVYLKPKKNSQLNFLIGFLPANNQTNKLQLTGDVNLNLKNSFGNGETILLNWQQLQLQSPRLNVGYQQPYFLKTAFGIDFAFDLFKKDSTFLQLNTVLGVQYLLSANQSGKLFFQRQSTILLGAGVDTNLIKATKTLPPNIDVSATNIGIDYSWNNTNYRFNPSKGNDIRLVGSVGIKNIKQSNDIINLNDPNFNYSSLYDSLKLKTYQVRVKLTGCHYFKTGKRTTLKTAVNTAIFYSENTFRNELFQIGGYKLLRGFDEESIFATQYAVGSLEYRYIIGQNSYLFAFADAGWVKNQYQTINISNQFTSAGLGILFETKLGLLNLSYALGKRNEENLDVRRGSKIHFGYINYF